MPGARAIGAFERKPMRRQEIAAPKQVAAAKAGTLSLRAGIPLKMRGLTKRIYAIVINVVKPARASVWTLVFRFLS
jgi:hypothetical protein